MAKKSVWIVLDPKMLSWLQVVSKRRKALRRADHTYGQILEQFVYAAKADFEAAGEWDPQIMGMLPKRGEHETLGDRYISRVVKMDEGLADWTTVRPTLNVVSGQGPRSRSSLFHYSLLWAAKATGGTGDIEGLPDVIEVPVESESDILEGLFSPSFDLTSSIREETQDVQQ